ncbi:MAG TPA: MarR family transcriptional regulator [Xanthobacteraceae bacterium]|nr:MarR family transcriptional regulator [Xanthobacteraceae bacterium]
MTAKSPTASQVSACVGFRLRKLTRRVSQVYDQMLAPLDLTGTQFSLLSNLATNPDISIGELAERLMMDPTTLTRTLRPLERRRLVGIAATREDRRRRKISLTPAGQALFREAVPLWRAAQARIAELMGERSFDLLDRSLNLSLEQLAEA